MKRWLVRGFNQKLASLIIFVLFIGLGIHFYEHDPLSHFHFHNLIFPVVNQASSNLLTDGHICPCFMATLAMPIINVFIMTILNETNLAGIPSPRVPFFLTWEIFHPPQSL